MAGLERALPAPWYLSDDRFGQERERLLFREWFCAGRADQVERPGSLAVVDVAGESVLLVRTRAGELRAHYNVCRHRGSQLVPCPPADPGGPQASPARKAGSLRCPYHSWTYRLEGDLLRAPWSEEIDGFDQAAFGLHPRSRIHRSRTRRGRRLLVARLPRRVAGGRHTVAERGGAVAGSGAAAVLPGPAR